LDLPALKYAIMLNGVTELIMMKSDVLSGIGRIKVCTQYKYKGALTSEMPYDVVNEPIEPVYSELNGWDEDLTGVTSCEELPDALHAYIGYIEKETGVPVTIVSVGPDRTQTLQRAIPA
jgi:adenylosuccinate synthase